MLHIHGTDGARQEPLASFFLGPGKTTLKAGDLVEVKLPKKEETSGMTRIRCETVRNHHVGFATTPRNTSTFILGGNIGSAKKTWGGLTRR